MSSSAYSTTKWWLLLTFLLVPLVNYIPVLLRVDQFMDDAETRVDAAGYAFSIWGVIFLGMIGFAYTLFREKDGAWSPALQQAAMGLSVAGLASMLFVPISIGGNQLLVWLDLLLHLAALLYAYPYLRQHVANEPTVAGSRAAAWRRFYFAPSMYMGWISAATVIATALMLDHFGIRFAPALEIYGAVALVVVLFLIGSYLVRARDAVYGATVAWALVAVGVEQADAALLAYTAWGGAALLLLQLLVKRQFYASAG